MTDSPPALLLVDDRPENLIALEASLEPLGHRLVRANSGEEALRHLLREEFAAVILDVQMPGLDGFSTAEAIRGRERTQDIPIIFLTAISRDDAHQLRGFATGAVDYIFKPVDPELLRAKVGVFVRLYTAERQLRAQLQETSRQAAELARSNADLDQFASVVSHDLLDPVNVITGYLELLQDRLGPALDDETTLWVERIRSCAERVHSLVAGLLDYSRLAEEREGPAARPLVPVGDAVADALENLEAVIAGAEATIEIEGDLPAVAANRDELTRVFQNLIGNAIVHGGEAVIVTVSAQRREDEVVITVADNGRGLPPEQMERVFGVFERSGEAPQPRTGLGLAICRRIVLRAGGRIWIEPGSGPGLAVRFSLPGGP
jgi:signal transduction histidine kinase